MAKTNPGFSEEEKKAMKERAAELRASKKADASEKAMFAKSVESVNGLIQACKDIEPSLA